MMRLASLFKKARFLTAGLLLSCASENPQESVLIAAATNFEPAMVRLIPAFVAQSGYDVQVSYGSTGKLYAQIRSGAPFDIFLSADAERAEALAQEMSRPVFIYALGGLSLYSLQPFERDKGLEILFEGNGRIVALANPELAPYGKAAQDVLSKMTPAQSLGLTLVTGENVGQAYTLVATGNADYGFISNAQALVSKRGFILAVSDDLHAPIVQKAVQITSSHASDAFAAFLKSNATAEIIQASGYTLP